MGECRDCNHWHSPNKCATVGRCDKLFMCVEVEDVCSPIYWTTIGFGCDLFTSKPKGPFVVCNNQNGWFVVYVPTDLSITYTIGKATAEGACKRLNKLWQERDCKQLERRE